MDTNGKRRKRRSALRIALGVFAGVVTFVIGGAFVFALLIAFTFSAMGWGRVQVSGAALSVLFYSLPPLVAAGSGLLGYSIAASARRLRIVSIVIWAIVIAEFGVFIWAFRHG